MEIILKKFVQTRVIAKIVKQSHSNCTSWFRFARHDGIAFGDAALKQALAAALETFNVNWKFKCHSAQYRSPLW